MTMLEQAARQALAALEDLAGFRHDIDAAIAALREVLETNTLQSETEMANKQWNYRETSGFDYGSTIYSIPGICTNINKESDARLLAAAPELLEALESFLRAPSAGSSGPGSLTIIVQDFNLRAARAAITKATGKPE